MTKKQVMTTAVEHVNEERLVDLFLELAKINGPSTKEQLVADYLIQALPELGFTLEFDKAHEKYNGEIGNLVAWREGTDPSITPLFFSTHMDTVLPTQELKPVLKMVSSIPMVQRFWVRMIARHWHPIWKLYGR